MSIYPRFSVASLLLAYAAAGFFWGVFAALTPVLKSRAGMDDAGFGLLLLALTTGAIPALLLFGRIVGRIESWALPACLATMGLGTTLLSIAGGTVMLAVAFLALGAASGALDIALNMRASALERANGLHLFQRAHGILPIASVVGSVATGVLRDLGVGPAVSLLAAGAVLGVSALTEHRSSSIERAARSAGGPRDIASTDRTVSMDAAQGAASQSPIIAWPLLATLGAVGMMAAASEMTGTNWSAIFAEDRLGTGAALAGLASGLFLAGVAAGRLGAHALQVRLSDIGLLRLGASLGIPAFGIVAFSATLGPGGTAFALAGLFLAGLAVGPVEPTVYRAVTHAAPDAQRGAWLSSVTGITYVGFLASPPMIGAMVDGFGWAAAWGLLGLFSAIILAVSATSIVRRIG